MEKKTDFKTLTTKAKFQYIWDYYRWHIIIGLCILGLIIYGIVAFVTYKEPVLNVTMVNCFNNLSNDTAGFDDFMEQEGFDLDSQCVGFSNSLTLVMDTQDTTNVSTYESLTLRLTAGDEDVFFSSSDVYDSYAEEGCMLDLTTLLTEEELEQYADYIIYTTDSESGETYPCGVSLTNNSWINEYGYYNDECYFGILYTSEHTETAINFFKYVLSFEQ